MKILRNYLNKIKPNFEEGGKLSALRSVFDGMETFLFVPNDTAKCGVNIHDAIDSKRIMSFVVIALLPAMLVGMYNIGFQNYAAAGVEATWWQMFLYGLVNMLPKIIVSYGVGLGIEFIAAQIKKEEIHEGFLVSGLLIPMIVPVGCPLWIIAIATAFAVIFAKEVFGGTGMNIVNVALIARAFIFFAYPSVISGDTVWVATEQIFGLGANVPDGYTCATALQFAANGTEILGATGSALTTCDMLTGLMPGSIGETSVIAIAIGAVILLWSGVASWKVMFSVFVGGIAMSLLFQNTLPDNPVAQVPFWQHLILGGFCFGAVFMATDPVTAARTEVGKYFYGFGIGAMAILIRVLNPGYPEGMMLAILLMNVTAPFIDYCVVQANVNARARRLTKKN
ncbi:MAG: NADH:ubiquinone reductase (Na(+)-transporting) subunit B [Bacteroidaceae bacterium]|nr:NADH:ubiquinone reductase (Na(+)-transporting) subunit B [Bacteroidaceae bacterium]